MKSRSSILLAANARLLGQGDLDAIADFFTADYRAHVNGGDLTGGHDTIRKVLNLIHKAFDDIQIDVEILVAGRKRIAWQRTIQGRQTGPYKGFPASGRIITWRDMITSEFRDGRIAQEWVVTNLAERLLLSRKA